jgi:carbamoyltransferase
MYILGIWDGHDSGTALVKGDEIAFAVNEERLTRRKLEVTFPEHSIRMILDRCSLDPGEINHIAISTYDFAKTLARIFPSFKEEYYLIRRRKKQPTAFSGIKKRAKYKLTELGPLPIYKWIGGMMVRRKLRELGFSKFMLHFVNHHLCHSAGAAFASGFDSALVLTIDGIGDGLSGTISVFEDGELRPISFISGRDSLGIFFEHVTNLLHMRELEDEGKVMALAGYAYPVADDKNPLLDFFHVEGLKVKSRYSSLRMLSELKKVLWRFPPEQFAYMAQRTIEKKVVELVRKGVAETSLSKVVFAGGVASNIKLNMRIRDLPEIEDCFIFPHMADGGLALGAAFYTNYQLNGISSYRLNDLLFLGPDYSPSEIEKVLKQHRVRYEKVEEIEKKTAELIASGNIVMWFQGRMEVGPRALGARSILARPDSLAIKDILNLRLKKRVWYQPFCPSLLVEDAKDCFTNLKGEPNLFMTSAYLVKEEMKDRLRGVINIDRSCRPQIVCESDSRYAKLLRYVKELTGLSAVLNTSYNIHGEPIVCSPEDAVSTFIRTGCDYLAIADFLVSAENNKREVDR